MKKIHHGTERRRADKFRRAVDRMPVLLRELRQPPLRTRDALVDIPKEGVYVFYERGKALYVGRSRNLRSRILNHGRKSSNRFQATFAFLIAMKQASRLGIKPPRPELRKKPTRKDWEKDPRFSRLFAAARQRVAKMKVRVLGVPDPIEQMLFEVYAADRLETLGQYNTFETH